MTDRYEAQVALTQGVALKDANGDPDPQRGTDGAAHLYGLAKSAVIVTDAAPYTATEVLGFRILDKGSGTLTFSPISGVTDIVVLAADLADMVTAANADWPIHCDSGAGNGITCGTGVRVLAYIPS